MKKLDIEISEIARGAELSLKNAQDLEQEAALLTGRRMFSRALFLHQISMEECAKVDMLGAWAMGLLSGLSVDQRTIQDALSRHKAKNFANAYFTPASPEEIEARDSPNRADAQAIFRETQRTFHEKSNSRKNAALYVDIENDRFVSPAERITEEMVCEIAEMNAQFIQRSQNDVKALKTWTAEPAKAEEKARYLVQRLEELRGRTPNEQMSALDNLLEDMLTKFK